MAGQNLGDLIEKIFNWAINLVGITIFFAFLYAGFLWFTAAGRPQPIAKAKEMMTNAVIGTIIFLASYLILHTINPDFVKQTFTLPGVTTQQPNSGGGGGGGGSGGTGTCRGTGGTAADYAGA
ncbi:MAG: pilin, partial [Candidatus Paceibacteria bacterium]